MREREEKNGGRSEGGEKELRGWREEGKKEGMKTKKLGEWELF